MTMIHYLPTANRSSLRPSSGSWLNRLSGQISALHTSWQRARMLRALEALPPETLKDIGWPTTDSNRTRFIHK
ncbi:MULTISPECIES: hypothetical protein [unclassified Rhizobium]|uniref:hypothetical protein n=1 Tax=unclassified Rhizobium TaxID=2613769 RepID=UPI0024797D65|nr:MULTISPECIES: hypothetical protein [unclassified Rhizobium]MDH7801060.1 hypothetical protein [Rhizobium sp. AN70]